MNKKIIYGVYNDEEVLLEGVKHIRSKNVKIKNVITPFPVHGLDKAMGLPRTRIAIAAFCYGAMGTSLALFMMWYMMIHDWPMDIGGKPNVTLLKNLPAFIPVTFEATVLCAAHLMVITFLLRSKVLPGVVPYVPHPRVSDDMFVMEIHVNENELTGMQQLLSESGAVETRIR
jgi:hypothetical protein